jgi:NADH pyrophosphatase NudC (nudix superfamily)
VSGPERSWDGMCPDCNATSTFTQITPGVFVLAIAHDNTCLQLAARVRKQTDRKTS